MAKRNADYTESDAGIFDQPKNLSPSESDRNDLLSNKRASLPIVAVPQKKRKEPVKFDPESEYYDMSGEKILLIFNHIKFDEKYFDGKTTSREWGTFQDAASIDTLFTSLGFKVKQYTDEKYANINAIVTDLCQKDHSATSCVAVVIMTHGFRNGILSAYDTTYRLSEIIEIFEKGHDTLIHKPKLFFIQACRGELVDPGKITFSDGPQKMLIHVPTHIEYLFARSTVEDYRAWREASGSWFLQELCNVVKDHHNTKDLLQMLTLVTRRVAYDHKSFVIVDRALSDKKATPETRFTLTKLLKF